MGGSIHIPHSSLSSTMSCIFESEARKKMNAMHSMAATNSTNHQNLCVINAPNHLANNSIVSGEEEIIWIEKEEEGTNSVGIKEGKKTQEKENEPKKEVMDVASSKGEYNTLSTSQEADRFPDEISISAESEEQSDQQDDREIEPNRLLATLENLVVTSAKQNGAENSTTSNATNQREKEKKDGMNGSMLENSLQKLSMADGLDVQLTIFSSSVEASESKVVELNELSKDSVETNKRRNDKEFPVDIQKENGTYIELMKPSKALEEFSWQMTKTIIPIEKNQEIIERVNKEATESISNKEKNDSAIQFSFKSIPKKETPPPSVSEELDSKPRGETKVDQDEDLKISSINENNNLEIEETAPKMETKTEESVDKQGHDAANISSHQLGVRFADGQRSERGGSLKDEDLAKLEEYEKKMRRRSKETLELVDRICGLQVQEGEKHPPLPKHKSIEEPLNSQKSSANTSSGEKEKDHVKEALVASIHRSSDAPEKGRIADPIQMKQSFIQQIGEGPVLNVESFSVNSSILHSPSDCILLPGQLLLILDSDAGLSLISLESKQLVKQLSPKQGIWRNVECACFDGEHIYVLLEYNVNCVDSEANKKIELTASTNKIELEKQKQEMSSIDKQKDGQKADKNEGGEENASTKESKSMNGQPRGIVKSNNVPKGDSTSNIAGLENDEPNWRQFICRFYISDFGMIDRIEAPKWLRERVVWHCRMCFVPQTKCLYLAANTPNQGFIFELRCAEARWTECVGTRRHTQFADLHHFAVVGPVTELLLVETNSRYVQLVSIYNSNVVSSRTLGICENPGSLCVDEKGHVLIFDRATATVGLFSRAFLEKVCDLALVGRAHCQLSARQGVLAILCRVTKEIRIHRYGNKLRHVEEMLYEGGNEPSI